MNASLPLLVATLILAGCNLLGASPAGVSGRTFLSTGVTVGGQPKPLVDGTRIRLTFSDDRSIGAQAGCNIMGGTYRVDGATLRFEGGSMTEMGCDPDRHAQDDWLMEFLGSGPTLALNGNELVLRSGDTTITLLDREIAEPDLPLVGTVWTVTTIVDGDVATGVAGVVASLTFDAAGNVALNAGCNQGGGRYTVEGTRIRFSDLVLTKMACDGARAQMEAAVLRTLDANPELAIEASNLTLRAGNVGLSLAGARDL